MAKFATSASDSVFKIERFLGVNECPDGDTNLKMGEASNMQNFKITDNGALQLRGGTRNVAGLISEYTINTAAETTTVMTELNSTTAQFTVYPSISVSSGGLLTLSGTSATVNYANHASYADHYYDDGNGNSYKFADCIYTQPSTGTLVPGGSVDIAADTQINGYPKNSVLSFYNSVSVQNGAVVGTDIFKTIQVNALAGYINDYIGKYVPFSKDGEVGYLKITSITIGSVNAAITGNLITYIADEKYEWKFYPVTATTNSNDTTVRGIWSGYVGSVEYIVAACNGFLWSLTEADGVWTKTAIGAIDTTKPVHMFGFDSNLYILDGTDYKVWNGTTLVSVTGYRPLVSVATVPAGGGTQLEQVNKLNGLRRVRFSPDGTATEFQLPETGLVSIDYVKKVSDGSAVTFTANTTTGKATISPAPVAGTDSLEIGYTVSATARASVVGMKFSETYNGETDTRVFLYGNGTNKAFYSGISFDTGKPSAEYFPDMNEIAVDKSNTPITAMIKHYDRLLTFKSDGAFITTYGTVRDAMGNSIAAFYTSPLNREIGNVALGQATLVKNNPFTLYGRSVYEWQLSNFAAKDERNAKRKSDRVNATLAGMNLTSAICFDDEFHTEYYIVQGDTAVVYNYTTDAWYIYKNFPAVCMITYKQELYFGTADGYIRHVSRAYMNDNGTPIEAYWESGSMDFGAPHKRKYSKGLWLGIKPEENGEIKVTAITDRVSELSKEVAEGATRTADWETSASGFFDFLNLDFTTLSFNVSDMPRIGAHKIKAKKFTYYKLIFSSANTNTTATVTNAEIAVRYTSNVR